MRLWRDGRLAWPPLVWLGAATLVVFLADLAWRVLRVPTPVLAAIVAVGAAAIAVAAWRIARVTWGPGVR